MHPYPGFENTNLGKDTKDFGMAIVLALSKAVATLVAIPIMEVGECHTHVCTSARYAARSEGPADAGELPLGDVEEIAAGVYGKVDSGAYAVEPDGEAAGSKERNLLFDGAISSSDNAGLWKHTTNKSHRVTGSISITKKEYHLAWH